MIKLITFQNILLTKIHETIRSIITQNSK